MIVAISYQAIDSNGRIGWKYWRATNNITSPTGRSMSNNLLYWI